MCTCLKGGGDLDRDPPVGVVVLGDGVPFRQLAKSEVLVVVEVVVTVLNEEEDGVALEGVLIGLACACVLWSVILCVLLRWSRLG